MEGDTGGLLIILEDQKAEIQRLFHKNSNLASKFEYKVDIPVFTNDELIAFARSYARELGFSYDEFAVLALYDRIGNGQTNDHRVSVAEVKDMVDAAIEHSEKVVSASCLQRSSERTWTKKAIVCCMSRILKHKQELPPEAAALLYMEQDRRSKHEFINSEGADQTLYG